MTCKLLGVVGLGGGVADGRRTLSKFVHLYVFFNYNLLLLLIAFIVTLCIYIFFISSIITIHCMYNNFKLITFCDNLNNYALICEKFGRGRVCPLWKFIVRNDGIQQYFIRELRCRYFITELVSRLCDAHNKIFQNISFRS